jgi:kynurenine formamidase
VTVVPVDQRTRIWPYDQQWNITVERELPNPDFSSTNARINPHSGGGVAVVKIAS